MIPQVERKDLNAMFTCQAVSQQLDIPVSTQVRLDLTCKSILNVFIASGALLFRLGLDEWIHWIVVQEYFQIHNFAIADTYNIKETGVWL